MFLFLKKKKTKVTYEEEKLKYTVPTVTRTYIPDFVVTRSDGTKLYIETKGYFRPADRSKMILVKKSNPSLDIRFLFVRNNKINKRSKTTYSDWCEKNGFPYAFGREVPLEWLS